MDKVAKFFYIFQRLLKIYWLHSVINMVQWVNIKFIFKWGIDMRIMLIQPKMTMRPMDTKLKTQMSPSLALLTLKNLTPKTHLVTIVNENIEDINYSAEVDLVGITVTVDVFNSAIQISKRFRARGVAVIVGGIHITTQPEIPPDYFDAICVGMAEGYWLDVLKDFEERKLKKIYKVDEQVACKNIASPDYSAIDRKKYLYSNVITTSRGCPYACDFCYNSAKNATAYIKRPIKHVIQDILALKSKHIMFIDDNLIGDPKWTFKFLQAIKGLNIKWNAAISANIINHLDLLDLMKETGCKSLFIGFETINQKSLNDVNKKQNDISKYERIVREIHNRGIMINASVVFGLDNDDRSVFDETLRWAIENKIETVTAHILTPYPGTRLYQQMLDEHRIIDYDLSHYNTANVVFMPKNMTPDELYNGYINFYKELYSTGNIFKRLPKDRKQWIPYILFNFFYRKFGKFTESLSVILPLNLVGKIASLLSYQTK